MHENILIIILLQYVSAMKTWIKSDASISHHDDVVDDDDKDAARNS